MSLLSVSPTPDCRGNFQSRRLDDLLSPWSKEGSRDDGGVEEVVGRRGGLIL